MTLIYSLCFFFLFQGCSSDSSQSEFDNRPLIDAVEPLSGSAGTAVTISGNNFSPEIRGNTIQMGETGISVTSASPTKLLFAIPPEITPGEYLISVTTGNATSAAAQLFTVIAKSEITDQEVLDFNYAIGTQTIGPSYGHTGEDRLVETAKAISNMGSNILKITLAPGSYQISRNYNDLVSLVRDDPSFRQVLDMPFSSFFFWARSHANWKDGYNDTERIADSTQIADLTRYLLTRYNLSGKKFFIGHWEGDWYLLDNYNPDFIPSEERIKGMIQWYITRQNAVDEALKNTPHQDVEVFTYAEVNRVVDAINGKIRVINHVVPYTNVDYVSYSSYDAQNLAQNDYNNVLNFIEGNLPSRPHIQGKRVFIGEMGRSAMDFSFSKSRHEEVNRENIKKALNWGTPYVLYWEMYNNEIRDGVQRGFWLIDDKNEKWPLYHTFSNFYEKAKVWVYEQKKSLNRMPTPDEYLKWAAENF